jgi:hypothetical protein
MRQSNSFNTLKKIVSNLFSSTSCYPLFLTVLIFVYSSANAQDRRNPNKIDCEGWTKKDLNLCQMGMNECAIRDANAAQKKLTQLISELRATFLANQKKFGTSEMLRWQQLEQSQKSWEQSYRKGLCLGEFVL